MSWKAQKDIFLISKIIIFITSDVSGQDFVQKKNLLGTKDYMSPEILSGYIIENGELDREAMMESEGVRYTKMVDIWALGIILYNTIFTTQPFCNVPGRIK